MMYGFGYMPFGFFWGLTMFAFWALVIWAIIAFIKWMAVLNRGDGPRGAAPPEKSPLEILQERYAKGEITKKEYEQKKADLM